ncbi:hypothetical protein C7447_10658 [Tenacibaculum adriaticum]|uniref:GLPGLI family protein n=1 Tax=Tenacibaculum adriaticum TaxID=413713 RepID=A0A5S5DPZ5_9FLAO|nr:hypothetical protein [Tenacibaculum adriaticum]TYP96759.1 hypothetical protein C7447_10658 [Tenacibaculum adriaticum]
MKKNLILLLLLSSINSFSQYQKGTLFLRDNSKITGLIKISNGFRLKFRENEKSKRTFFNYRKVKKVVFDDKTEYVYKIESQLVVLLKKEISGKLELFSRQRASAPTKNKMDDFLLGKGPFTEYFIADENSDFADKLPLNFKSKNYRKILSKHTLDCTDFQNKIKDKKSIKSNFDFNISQMINYYNDNCN